MRAPRSCRRETRRCAIVIMAIPPVFGDPSFLWEYGRLGLCPARPPGLLLSRLWPGAFRLFRPDPTSLSTSVDTGDRGASDRKPDDNARAKCGARECRQDQNHDHPSCEENNNPNPSLESLPIDMRCKFDASSPKSRHRRLKYNLAVAGLGSARRSDLPRRRLERSYRDTSWRRPSSSGLMRTKDTEQAQLLTRRPR